MLIESILSADDNTVKNRLRKRKRDMLAAICTTLCIPIRRQIFFIMHLVNLFVSIGVCLSVCHHDYSVESPDISL